MYKVISKTYNDWDVDMIFINLEDGSEIFYAGYDIDENGDVIEEGQVISDKTFNYLIGKSEDKINKVYIVSTSVNGDIKEINYVTDCEIKAYDLIFDVFNNRKINREDDDIISLYFRDEGIDYYNGYKYILIKYEEKEII